VQGGREIQRTLFRRYQGLPRAKRYWDQSESDSRRNLLGTELGQFGESSNEYPAV